MYCSRSFFKSTSNGVSLTSITVWGTLREATVEVMWIFDRKGVCDSKGNVRWRECKWCKEIQHLLNIHNISQQWILHSTTWNTRLKSNSAFGLWPRSFIFYWIWVGLVPRISAELCQFLFLENLGYHVWSHCSVFVIYLVFHVWAFSVFWERARVQRALENISHCAGSYF